MMSKITSKRDEKWNNALILSCQGEKSSREEAGTCGNCRTMANNYFVIIGSKDNPLYEVEFGNLFKEGGGGGKGPDLKHLNQFIVHQSLDIVDEVVWGTQSNYLKIVDRYADDRGAEEDGSLALAEGLREREISSY